MNIKTEYLNLIEQFQIYLMQEYSAHSWIDVSRESYWYYRKFAASMKQGSVPRTIIQETNELKPTELKSPPNKAKNLIEPTLNSPQTTKIHTEIKRALSPQPSINVSSAVPKEAVIVEQKPSLVREKDNFADIRKIIAENFPEQIILQSPPDDAAAKSIKNAWKKPFVGIYLLISSPQISHFSLITNICKAIKMVYRVKAEAIDKNLFKGHDKIPFIDLGDLEVYIRNPSLKAKLWNAIAEKIKV